MNKQENITKKIEDLIEGIDEFNEKYVTYNARVLRTILVETLDYIKQNEQALDEIEKNIKDYCRIMCMAETRETCESCQNTEILDIIDRLKEN